MVDSLPALWMQIYALQRSLQRSLSKEFLSLQQADGLSPWLAAVGLAAVFGAVHALTPGHGKAVLASYLINRGGTWRDGIGASARTILTHVLGAVLLVGTFVIILDMSLGMRPADYPQARIISYGMISVIAVLMLAHAIRDIRNRGRKETVPRSRRWVPYLAGLSPCPLTTIILIAAIARDMFATGLLVVAAMTAGMLATVGAVSVGVILFRDGLVRIASAHPKALGTLGHGLQILGAFGLLAFSVTMLLLELR